MKLPSYVSLPILAIAVTFSTSCADVETGDQADVKRSETEVIIENLELAGYPASEIGVLADGTVFVGGDAVVTLQASREMAGIVDDVEHADGFRGYRTTNMVDTSVVSTICINSSAAFDSNAEMSQALNLAIANYNSQNLQFTMVRGNSGCDATINANLDNSSGGVAGFPSNGLPYEEFFVGSTLAANNNVDVAAHVITHEMGHCIGFRHTDYYNRSISCGGGASNEGDAGVGAIHIPGTSETAVLNGSVMNACYNGGSTGTWTNDDETALDCLYASGSCAPPPPPSYSGTSEGISGAQGSTLSRNFDATGASAVRVSISGGSGDADLYVRHGDEPTTDLYDCRPYLTGNNETCEFNPSQDGIYYIEVVGYAAYSGATLTIESDGGGNPDPDPDPGPEVCDDGEDNDGDEAIDCDDSDCNDDVACQAPPPPDGWQDLLDEDFDSGWGVFKDGGNDAALSTGWSSSGTHSARIRDNSSASSSTSSNDFDLSGYSELRVNFSFAVSSMENGEDFFVEFDGGNGWEVIGQYVSGDSISNGNAYTTSLTINSGDYDFGNASSVRFRCDASGNNDRIYIDDVLISAQ